jgi:hypothetical protein
MECFFYFDAFYFLKFGSKFLFYDDLFILYLLIPLFLLFKFLVAIFFEFLGELETILLFLRLRDFGLLKFEVI